LISDAAKLLALPPTCDRAGIPGIVWAVAHISKWWLSSLCGPKRPQVSVLALRMAANFWASSHRRRWLFSEQELRDRRARLRGSLSEREADVLEEHLHDFMKEVGKVAEWRMPVVATARLLFKRFFVMASLDAFDPRLLAVTALYMAAKVEELGQYYLPRLLHHVRKVTTDQVHEIAKEYCKMPRAKWCEYVPRGVHDCEFHILDKLSFDLVMFHPYRYLLAYGKDAGLSDECASTAWDIVNDSYITDVPLIYPPYLTALAAIYIASVFHKLDVREWFNRLNVKGETLKEITRTIVNMMDARASRNGDYARDLVAVMTKVAERWPEEQGSGNDKRAREQVDKNRAKSAKKAKP
jgi:cyclin C